MRDPQHDWGSWPDDGDPIGVASARLLALGVDRHERLRALRFLGILLDHAGAGGVVRAHPALIAGEFRLAAPAVDEYVSLLRRVGVLVADAGGLRIEGFRHHRSTGLPDGEALAIIGSVLGDGADDGESPEPAEPAVPLEHGAERGDRVPEVIDLTGAGAGSGTTPWSLAVPAFRSEPAADHEPTVHADADAEVEPEPVLVGAAVGAASTATPASRQRRAGTRPVRRPPVTSVLALLTGLVLVLSGVFARPGDAPRDISELAAGGPVTTIEVPSGLPRTFAPSTPAAPVAPLADADVGDGAGAVAAPPAPAPGTADAPADPPPSPTDAVAGQAAPCPDLVPAVSGVVARVEPADFDALLGASPWVVVVEGAVLGGAEPAVVSSLPVRVALADGSQINAEALTAPVEIAPGRLVRWETRAQTVSIAAPEVTTVTAGPPLSEWADATRAAACPIA